MSKFLFIYARPKRVASYGTSRVKVEDETSSFSATCPAFKILEEKDNVLVIYDFIKSKPSGAVSLVLCKKYDGYESMGDSNLLLILIKISGKHL